jgi:hypothetical protein
MVGEEEKEIKFEKGKENLTTVNAITLQILELNPIKNIDIPFNKDDYNLTLVIKNLTEE